jgi:hypothetical protein
VQTVFGDVNNSRYIPCAAELNGLSDDMGFFICLVRQSATFLFSYGYCHLNERK